MLSQLSSLARTSVIALVALGSLPAAAPAAPLAPVRQPVIADSANKPIPVAQGEGRDCGPGYSCGRNPRVFNRRNSDGGGWNNRRRNRDGDGWNGRRNWDGDGWNGRRYKRDYYAGDRRSYRRHWRRNNWRRYNDGAGFVLGLGLGVPLGYYGGYYDGYNEPVYRPRRVYRGGGGAHVEWCYDRYRSYRAWDNTYQPYNGPRRQCFSPYS